MHSSLITLVALVGLAGLPATVSGQVSLGPVTINGVLVTPGPGITGIKSPSDINTQIFDQLRDSGHLFKRVSGTKPICSDPGYKQASTSDVQTLSNYFKGLPDKQFCVIQNPQYASDCGNYACVTMAATGTATAYLCLTGDNGPSLSFAGAQCNSVIKYYVDAINSGCTNTQTSKVQGHEFLNGTDFDMSNNAVGNNQHSSTDVAVLIVGN